MRIFIHKLVDATHFITISEDNGKMGDIASFSLPCILTCPSGVPCTVGCYADCMEHLHDVVHESYMNNLEMLRKFPVDVENTLVEYIDNDLYTLKFFRFNVAGDVEVGDNTYLNLILNVVNRCKNTKFLVYTKSARWNKYKVLPANLSLLYSYWGSWKFDNPHNHPTTNVMFEPDEEHMAEETKGKLICRNCLNKEIHCDTCHICWNLKPGQCVWFFAHGIKKSKINLNVPADIPEPQKQEKPKRHNYRDAKGRFCKKPSLFEGCNRRTATILGQVLVKAIKEMSPLA